MRLLIWNGTHKLLSNADDVNMVGEDRYHTEKLKVTLDAGKEVGVEVNPEQTKC
jgi:hypothetical protein